MLKAQRQVDRDLQLVNAAIKQENAACQPVFAALNSGTATRRPAATGSASDNAGSRSATTTAPSAVPQTSSAQPTTSAPPTTSTAPPGGPDPGQAAKCSELMRQVLDDQTRAAADENGLAGAEATLTGALNQAVAAAKPAAGTQGGSASTGRASGSAQVGSGSSGHGAGGPVSADQLAADQAAVDAADAEQAVVQQNIAAATLVSPIAGTVAQVGLTAGQTASGGSAQDRIVIIGPGANQVTTAVSDSQVGQVKNGQSVVVTPDGSGLRLTGTVTTIGVLGSTTSSGSAGYPVTISLDPTPQQLFPGATASVSITLASTRAPVAVPTSAVHVAGSRHVVTLLRGNNITEVRVTLGVVGSTVTQVNSGLNAGDPVVLADLNAPIPTAGTSPGRAFGGGGGRRAGG